MTPQERARQALVALQDGEVARIMGHSATPTQIRARADREHEHMYWLASRVEDLAAKAAGPVRNKRRASRRTKKNKRTSRRSR